MPSITQNTSLNPNYKNPGKNTHTRRKNRLKRKENTENQDITRKRKETK
jgi:hypothetical protein